MQRLFRDLQQLRKDVCQMSAHAGVCIHDPTSGRVASRNLGVFPKLEVVSCSKQQGALLRGEEVWLEGSRFARM